MFIVYGLLSCIPITNCSYLVEGADFHTAGLFEKKTGSTETDRPPHFKYAVDRK